jgi:hypothetical protein
MIKKSSTLLFVLLMIVFGIYFVTKPRNESFISSECPSTMIKDGDKIFLYNPKYPKVPGVNPIQLNSLEDYEEYVEWQRANKLNCPILHLEKVFNAQGDEQYQVKDCFDNNGIGGLNHEIPNVRHTPTSNSRITDLGQIIDASLDNPPYNSNQHPGYDPLDQDIGRKNVIDNYTFNYYTNQL